MYELLDVLLTLYQGFLFVYTIKKQFKADSHSIFHEIGFISLFTAFLEIIQHLEIPISELFVLIFVLIYIKMTTREKWITCLLWTIIDGYMFYGTLTVVSGLFDLQIDVNGNVTNVSNSQSIYLFVGNASITVSMAVAARFGKVRHLLHALDQLMFIVTLILGAAINECFFLSRNAQGQNTFQFWGVLSTYIMMLLTLLLYERLVSAIHRQHQAEEAAQMVSHQEELKSIYQAILANQHDINHRISAVEEIVKTSEYKNVDQALSLLQMDHDLTFYYTGCLSIDAIIHAKKAIMQKFHIFFDFIPYPISPLPIDERKFCTVIGNILDNAIEGVQRLSPSNNPYSISLKFTRVNGMLLVSCVNDADSSCVHLQKGKFLSTKTNPELHGHGISNVQKIVADADGMVDFSIENNKFYVTILLGDNTTC